jgi:hypothetical protein
MVKPIVRYTSLAQVGRNLQFNQHIIGVNPVINIDDDGLISLTVSSHGPRTPDGKIPRRRAILDAPDGSGRMSRQQFMAWANRTLLPPRPHRPHA